MEECRYTEKCSAALSTEKLIDYRQHLRNKVRRATPAEKEKLREEKQGVTEQITELRKRLKYADGIEKRSAHIDNCLDQIHDTIENQRPNRQKEPVKTDRRREAHRNLNPPKAKSKGMVVLLKRHKNIIIQSVKHG